MKKNKIDYKTVVVVIPYYNAAKHIIDVVAKLPDFIATIIIIDDAGKEELPVAAIEKNLNPNSELVILRNEENLGVGGATKRGFQYAISINAFIVIKVDSDNQMDTSYLDKMIEPLFENNAEMSKGNRFRDLKALKKMPFTRRFGNLFLSFLTKMATGYWNNFDPTNGFLAIKVSVLKSIDLEKLSNRYFFETSLISQLYFVRARIKDIAMPAIYGDEKSSMNLWTIPVSFSARLLKVFVKRLLKQYLLYDFSLGSIYLIFGLPMFLFGVIFGVYEWIYYASKNIAAPTGTIMVVVLNVILGFQLLLQGIQFDIINAPKAKE